MTNSVVPSDQNNDWSPPIVYASVFARIKASACEVAREFVDWFEYLPRATRIIVWLRVSLRDQKGHLRGQLANLRKAVEERGLIVVDFVVDTCKAKSKRNFRNARRAARLATKLRAVVLAESADRYCRPREFGPNNQQAVASRDDWKCLISAFEGVSLFTLAEPEATPNKVKSIQTLRGKKNSKKTKSKEIKSELIVEAQWMRDSGASFGKIATALDEAKSTIHFWLTNGTANSSSSFQTDDQP